MINGQKRHLKELYREAKREGENVNTRRLVAIVPQCISEQEVGKISMYSRPELRSCGLTQPLLG